MDRPSPDIFYPLGNTQLPLMMTSSDYCGSGDAYHNQLSMTNNGHTALAPINSNQEQYVNPATHFQPITYGYEQPALNVGIDLAQNMRELQFLTQGFQENFPFSADVSGGGGGMMTEMRRKRRRIITHDQRKAANVRERRRMYHLNEAFDDLRQRVPTFAYEKKLSRIETLKLAVTYIQFMSEMLGDLRSTTTSRNTSPCMSNSDCAESNQTPSDTCRTPAVELGQLMARSNADTQTLALQQQQQVPAKVSQHVTHQLMTTSDENSQKSCDYVGDIDKFLSNNCDVRVSAAVDVDSYNVLSCLNDGKM